MRSSFYRASLTLVLLALAAGCSAGPEQFAEGEVSEMRSEIVAGTVVTPSEAEREGLANVNWLGDVWQSGSGIVVNRRYVITAKHVVQKHLATG